MGEEDAVCQVENFIDDKQILLLTVNFSNG